jgi:hypothetical protein
MNALRRDAFAVVLTAERGLSGAIVRLCALTTLCLIGVRIQHTSNGIIRQQNDGMTFGELRISYRRD